MAKYHINPETGNPGICRAVHQCRFGADAHHYASKEEAQTAYEQIMAKEQEELLRDAALAEMAQRAKAGARFGRSNARNTDITEFGTQALAILLARGETIDHIADSRTFVDALTKLDSRVPNYDALLTVGAKVLNDFDNDAKFHETVVLATASYELLKAKGFTDEEISRNLRQMGTEITTGEDGTVGDVGINLPDGRYEHISLKSESNLLHNGTIGSLGRILDEPDYSPFEAHNVLHYDSVAFRAAGRFLRDKIEASENGVSWQTEDGETWSIMKDGDTEYLVHEKRGKEFRVPTASLTDLDSWKQLSQDQQKTLGSFITANSKEIEAIDEYARAVEARKRSINENLSGLLLEKDQVERKKVVAKFLGLRTAHASYVNYSGGKLETADIPTMDEFFRDSNVRVGAPIISTSQAGTVIPIFNEKDKTVSLIEIRTKFGNRQFNYKGIKVTGEYKTADSSATDYLSSPELKDYTFTTPMDNVFPKR